MLRISEKSFERLCTYITKTVGIKMPPSKVSMIQSRLLRRVRELGLGSLEDYCQHLFESPEDGDERMLFINAITTNKTDFYREPQHFRLLVSLLPELNRRRHGRGRLLVWSAACSSGEEPYTLAMVLANYGLSHPHFDFHILATDISTRVLATARHAVYARQLATPLPAELRRRYLLQARTDGGATVRVAPDLRRTISFHQLNLMDAHYPVHDMFDVVFCRNVLIYFDRPTQEAVIGRLCRNLKVGGYLFISHSETLSGLDLPLEAIGSSCYRRIQA